MPDELASAKFKPDTVTNTKVIAIAREMLVIPIVVGSSSFDYFGVALIHNNLGDSPGRNRTDVPGTKTRDDGPLHYRTVVVGP